jgi:glucose/arabinose dehydrogenase
VALLTLAVAAADAQQAQGGRQGGRGGRQGGGAFAPPPINWPSPPLGDGPFLIESGDERNLKVVVVTKGLSHPWALAFLPDGTMLVTERAGRLRVIRNGVLNKTPVSGVPRVNGGGLSGLKDLALHPRFTQTRWVYMSYDKPADAGGGMGVSRGQWNGTSLRGVKEIFATGDGGAMRLAFGRDGMLYAAVSGGGGDGPQDPNSYSGKILRLRDDGTVPPDNPFVGRAGYLPQIYSMGHRTPLAMAVNPATGDLWAGEQGPNGGDELNIIRPGRNYGWPVISHGRNYMGPKVSESPWRDGMEQPEVVWVPSIALSGMAFYTGDRFPRWKGNSLFVGGLREGEVPRTGQIQRVVFNAKGEEIRREPMLRELHQRIRDVRQGPDGYLYLLTEEEDGALLRIEPGAPAAPSPAR